ncbi:MAG: Spo0B domain-containing protein, partial [Firmicutes bacterium]|nr:Spo0B domain-containing protein [Bacillota bacterium]
MRIVILMALGAGVFASPLSWRILFLMLFGIYIMLWVRLSSQSQSVEIVRRYRHRYANHLQVVLGWLQLQQSERAEQYVTEHALSSLHPGIFRGVPLRWTYQMIALDAYAESLGHMIFWVNPEQISG